MVLADLQHTFWRTCISVQAVFWHPRAWQPIGPPSIERSAGSPEEHDIHPLLCLSRSINSRKADKCIFLAMSTAKMATCKAVRDGALKWGSWSSAGKSSVSSLVHSCTPRCHAVSKRTPVTSWYAPARVARGPARNETYNNTNTHWQAFSNERWWHEATVVLVHNCDWFTDAYAMMRPERCQDQLQITWPQLPKKIF